MRARMAVKKVSPAKEKVVQIMLDGIANIKPDAAVVTIKASLSTETNTIWPGKIIPATGIFKRVDKILSIPYQRCLLLFFN